MNQLDVPFGIFETKKQRKKNIAKKTKKKGLGWQMRDKLSTFQLCGLNAHNKVEGIF